MRRALVLVVAGVLLLCAAPASAAERPDQRWSPALPVSTFAPTPDRIYVGSVAGVEEARAFVSGTTDSVVTLFEVAAEGVMVDPPGLAACPLISPLGDTAPNVDCSSPVELARSPDGAWAVTMRSDFGAAIVPLAGRTFRVAFDTTKTTVAAPIEPVAPELIDASGDVSVPAVGFRNLTPTPADEEVVEPVQLAVAPAAPVVAAAAKPLLPVRAGNAASPPALVVLSLLGFVAAIGTWRVTNRHPNRAPMVRGLDGSSARVGVGALALLLLPMLLAETTVYKLGLVLIVVVAGIGLHVLVNWAGELSLAHATLIGLPAFAVAKLSADHAISPIVLLPLAVIIGTVAGAVIGIPAIRARGLQVALVTLAAGVAIDRFFFTREWLVGDVSGARVSVPTLGPITLSSARALYPVLWAVVLLAVAAAWAIYRSKLGRGLLWVKAQPDAAAAFGIPVGQYRTLAYVLAGGFAGLAGGLTAMWVQRLTPAAFPLSRSFTYLIIVALAGRGLIGGVAAAAAFVEGGRLFLPNAEALLLYGAPIGLILTLTRHPAGLNGFGRQIKERIMDINVKYRPRPLVIAGVVALAIGFGAIALAWYHAGNTSQVWVQNQELVSGGVGGLALVVLGMGLIITDRLTALATALHRDDAA